MGNDDVPVGGGPAPLGGDRDSASSQREPVGAPGSISAAVLMGGAGRRMGRDKAQVDVLGRPLLVRVLDALLATEAIDGSVTLIGTDGERVDALVHGHPLVTAGRLRTVHDRVADGGPLVGLATALEVAGDASVDDRRAAGASVSRRTGPDDTTAVVVVPVDHPALEPAVLEVLISRLSSSAGDPDATVLATPTAPRGDPSVLATRTRATRRLTDALSGGERRLHAVFDLLDIEVVEPADWRPADPSGATLVDVDDEAIRVRVERWLRRRSATAPTPLAGPERASADPGSDLGVRRLPVVRIRDGQARDGRARDGQARDGRARDERARDELDTVIVEEPLEIQAHGPGQSPTTVVTTMRTPGHEAELAVGWLLSEGLIGPFDVVGVHRGDPLERARPDDLVVVRSRSPIDLDAPRRRLATATASCGLCGRASLDALAARIDPVASDPSGLVPLEVVLRLPDELRLAQPAFAATGGVHAAGLADVDGRLVTVREDVGRHNAVDAVIGAHALGGVWPRGGRGLSDLLLVLSGRIGFELVAKAAAAGVPVVIAVGASSDLAVRTAERLGVTLVGFVRGRDATIYTHPSRITGHDIDDTADRPNGSAADHG